MRARDDEAAGARDDRAALVYPFETAPGPGETIEIAERLHWARMPIPYALQHVNIWLLDEGDAWTAVDCGMDTPATRDAWDALARGPLRGRPIRRVVATHGHIDHIGYAGPLCAATGAEFHATRIEWLMAGARRQEAGEAARGEAERFYRRLGCSFEDAATFAAERAKSAGLMALPPPRYRRFTDGDRMAMGGFDWRVITCGGHAAEHAMFVCEAAKLFICADHLLPSIVPHTAVQACEPDEDTVGAYQAGLEKVADLSDELLVLPSHGRPFFGLTARIGEISAHRAQRLAAVEEAASLPVSVRQIAEAVFGRAARRGQLRQAVAQTAAYVNYLVARHRLETRNANDGVALYARPGAPGTAVDDTAPQAFALDAPSDVLLS